MSGVRVWLHPPLSRPELPDYPKPMKVSAQYAEEHFADLLTAGDSGEEVESTWRPG